MTDNQFLDFLTSRVDEFTQLLTPQALYHQLNQPQLSAGVIKDKIDRNDGVDEPLDYSLARSLK